MESTNFYQFKHSEKIFVWIKLIFLENKEINALIYGQRYNLFDLRQKFIWFEQIFFLNEYVFIKDEWMQRQMCINFL